MPSFSPSRKWRSACACLPMRLAQSLTGSAKAGGTGYAVLAMILAAACFATAHFFILVLHSMKGNTIVDWYATFLDQFDWLDVLWLGLALWPAYRVGKSGQDF